MDRKQKLEKRENAVAKNGAVYPASQSSLPAATVTAADKMRLLPSSRLCISVMCSLLIFTTMLLRINISISLVCMVKSTPPQLRDNLNRSNSTSLNVDISTENCTSLADEHGNNLTSGNMCGNTSQTYRPVKPKNQGEFEWSKRLQGFILSAYFWGYITTQAVGGWLGGRYGGKHVAGTGLLVSVVTTVLLPSAARFSPYCVIVLRVVLGAANGVSLPISQTLLGVWSPPLERTLLNAITYLGSNFGTMTALLVSAQFCELRTDNGWPFAFYCSGCAGFILWIAWNFTIYNSPSVHPRISKQEREYIARCAGTSSNSSIQTVRRPFPWLRALRTPAVMCIAVCQTAGTWLLYTNVTMFPMYMKDVLKFDIRQNGLYLMLPHMATIIINPFIGQLADVLRRRHILSTVAVRKISQGISHFGAALLLVCLTFVDHETRYVAIVINILVTALQAMLNRSGYLVSPQDIAPRYSGEVFGISNSFATLSGMIAPVICGHLTPSGTAEEWKNVFYIAAAVLTVGGIVFCVFAEGEVLSWAKCDDAADTIVDKTVVVTTSSNESSSECLATSDGCERDGSAIRRSDNRKTNEAC